MDMSLREKQTLFAACLTKLLHIIQEHRWAVTLSEGYVGDTDAKDGDHDGPHKAGGAHYNKLGIDLNLFCDGTWITDDGYTPFYRGGSMIQDGGHPNWKVLGITWENLHPLCRWGGRFNDANHFSIFHEGRS